jgi:hypothetical protein
MHRCQRHSTADRGLLRPCDICSAELELQVQSELEGRTVAAQHCRGAGTTEQEFDVRTEPNAKEMQRDRCSARSL